MIVEIKFTKEDEGGGIQIVSKIHSGCCSKVKSIYVLAICSFALILYELWRPKRQIQEEQKSHLWHSFCVFIRRKLCTIHKRTLLSSQIWFPRVLSYQAWAEWSSMFESMVTCSNEALKSTLVPKSFCCRVPLIHNTSTIYTVSLSYKTVENTVFKTRLWLVGLNCSLKNVSNGT